MNLIYISIKGNRKASKMIYDSYLFIALNILNLNDFKCLDTIRDIMS